MQRRGIVPRRCFFCACESEEVLRKFSSASDAPTSPSCCDCQSDPPRYTGGMRRILRVDIAIDLLALAGLVLAGVAVWLAWGLAAALGYAGAALIVVAIVLAATPGGRAE
jgi:hypothetical protein